MRLAVLALLGVIAGCKGEGPSGLDATSASPTATLPAEWSGKSNPMPNDAATIERGRAAFLKTCATCHGPEADGKGIASAGLTPPPANFRDGHRLSSKGDDFIYWRISEGITGSAMPSFNATLSDDDRWAIIRFLRSLPGAEAKATPLPERT